MQLSELGFNRNLYKTVQSIETQDAVTRAGTVTPNDFAAVASGSAANDVNTGSVILLPEVLGLSDSVAIISDVTALGVPTGLTAIATTSNVGPDGTVTSSVTLQWTAITGDTFDHYVIRYKIAPYTYYFYATSTTTTITIGGLVPNITYNFGISSVTKYGTQSLFSSDISQVTATSTTPPATVSSVSAAGGIQYVVLEWARNTETDLASYNIYRNTVNNSATATQIGNALTTYFVDGGLTGGTTYYYWVKAMNTSALVSASFSTVVSATPRNVINVDLADSSVTAAKTSIEAINPVDGEINANKVGTTQIVADAVTSAKILDGAITASKTNIAALSALTGNLNTGVVDTAQIVDNAVSSLKILAGAVTTSKIFAEAVTANELAANSVVAGKIAALTIVAGDIAADAITASKILAGSVTANKMTTYNFQVSAGTFTNNSPVASKIAWTGAKVVYNGTEYTITDSSCLTTDKHVYWQLSAPTVFLGSATLPALGNDDFLVLFNNSGTALYVWNSTIVNGNRITTGSITSTNITANTITANEIAANTITAAQIFAGTITATEIATNTITSSNILSLAATKVLIDGAVYLSNWQKSGDLTKIDGGSISANTITTTQLNFTPVQGSNVIASINASAEGITIDADNITISGATTFSSGYDPTGRVLTVGGTYDSAASGARVRIFPDANTGILVIDDVAGDVFKVVVGGTNVGDVIIGNYSANQGIFYDKSAGTTTFRGAIVGVSGTLGDITIGSNAWHVDSSGNMWWGNFASYAAATIKISSAGVANLSGLTVGANNVTAGTITGSTLQTASSGQRIVIDQPTNSIKVYNSGGANVGKIYGDASGGSTMWITAPNGNNLVLNAEGSSYVIDFEVAGSTTCYVTANGLTFQTSKKLIVKDGKMQIPVGTNVY